MSYLYSLNMQLHQGRSQARLGKKKGWTRGLLPLLVKQP